MRKLITTFCFLLVGLLLAAQTNVTRIEGVVLEANIAAAPIDFANVSLQPAGVYTLTNARGEFVFDRVNPGRATIRIEFLGMVPIDTTVVIQPGRIHRFEFRMQTESFRLQEVTVVATQNKAGQSTSSVISRQAIDHMQASTLTDIMQLLPGVQITSPDLTRANYVSIRGFGPADRRFGEQRSGENKALSNSNSFGTAIIVDGAPLSSNANLQSLDAIKDVSNYYTTVGGYGGASNGTRIDAGLDTRTLSLDNVESVEIIRGIPSVEYGDLSSGAIIVKSKTGPSPLQVRFKINPLTYQGSLSKGIALKENRGVLNLSGDYLYGVTNPTETYDHYQRFTAKGIWAKYFGKLYASTALDLWYGRDSRKPYAQDERTDRTGSSNEFGIGFNHNGTLIANQGWFQSLEYVVAGRYVDKLESYNWLIGSAATQYSTSKIDGTIVGNNPGERLYDVDGNEITRIPSGAEKVWATYLPNEYVSEYEIGGKEINVNAKIKANFYKQWETANNRIILGADYKMDGNRGKGVVYDDMTPPRYNGSNRGYRSRPFTEVPFIHQVGLFAEDRLQASLGSRDLLLTAGARFDYINGKTVVAPRTNLAIDLFPNLITLRGGYGITAKAPNLMHLYPENAYFDYRITSFSNLPTDLTIVKTRVYDPTNPDLKIATNRKQEVGLDLNLGKRRRLSLTWFDELRENDYRFGISINSYISELNQEYILRDGKLVEGNLLRIYNAFNQPVNDVYHHNRGLEFELDLGRFDAIRTSLFINGAYLHRESKLQGPEFVANSRPGSIERYIGIFDQHRKTEFYETALTTFRITHNIPSIGFVVTLTPQIIWILNEWDVFNNNWQNDGYEVIDRYISYNDGLIHTYDKSKGRGGEEFEYLMPLFSSSDYREFSEKAISQIYFHLNLTKEIGDSFTASFFVNNLFNSRPKYQSTKEPGKMVELGQKIYFGFELKMLIK